MSATLKVKPYEEADFDELEGWAIARKVMLIKALLPKIGNIIYNDDTGENLACGWLYMDNSVGVAFPHWLLTNPKNDMRISRESIQLLGEWMESVAKDLNYGCFVTFFEDGVLSKEAEKLGYKLVGKGQNIYIKLLEE